MRRVAYVCACVLSAATLAGLDTARAQESDLLREAEAAPESEGDDTTARSSIDDAHAQALAQFLPISEPKADSNWFGGWLAYGGMDGWRYGGSAYLGGEWSAPTSGPIKPIVRLFAADGLDDFQSRFATYRSETARASVLPGIHVQAGSLDIKLFAGGDFLLRIPLRPAPDVPVYRYGARASADIWWEPDPQWMLSGSASATSIEQGVSARLASGWRSPFGWVGPEVQANHDIFNTQLRAGAHLSGVRVGPTEWSVAGGYARDSFGRTSPYGRIGITLRP